MSDPFRSPESTAPGQELEIDLADFLPEGSEMAAEPDPPVELAEPAERPPAVDLVALTRIEAELAEVDAALVALDENDATRSPLLRSLMGDQVV